MLPSLPPLFSPFLGCIEGGRGGAVVLRRGWAALAREFLRVTGGPGGARARTTAAAAACFTSVVVPELVPLH